MPHTLCPLLHVINICHLWHIVLTLVVKERMWGVREAPSANSHEAAEDVMWAPSGAQSTGQTCVRDDEGHLGTEREREGKGAGSSWCAFAGSMCVCSSMLLLTQSLTVHPLTTPRSRQCVQMRRYYKYTRVVFTLRVFTLNCKLLSISDFSSLWRLPETKDNTAPLESTFTYINTF